jgi:hypothetical protein
MVEYHVGTFASAFKSKRLCIIVDSLSGNNRCIVYDSLSGKNCCIFDDNDKFSGKKYITIMKSIIDSSTKIVCG